MRAVLVVLLAAAAASAQNGESTSFAGDLRNFRYSPLDQINASNFGNGHSKPMASDHVRNTSGKAPRSW